MCLSFHARAKLRHGKRVDLCFRTLYRYGVCIPIIIRYGIICFSPYSVDHYHFTWEELDVDKSDADNDTDNDGKVKKHLR